MNIKIISLFVLLSLSGIEAKMTKKTTGFAQSHNDRRTTRADIRRTGQGAQDVFNREWLHRNQEEFQRGIVRGALLAEQVPHNVNRFPNFINRNPVPIGERQVVALDLGNPANVNDQLVGNPRQDHLLVAVQATIAEEERRRQELRRAIDQLATIHYRPDEILVAVEPIIEEERERQVIQEHEEGPPANNLNSND